MIRYTAPGKNPASATPNMIRQMTRPVKFFTIPVKVITIPQDTTRMPMYVEGRLNFLRRRLHGTSRVRSSQLVFGPDPDDWKPYPTFEKNVWDEEQREGDVVLYAIHAQILDHAFNLCVANVGSVDMSLCARMKRVSQVSRVTPSHVVRTHHEV